MRKGAPCIGPESHEPRNEFRVDPVSFGPCAPTGGEGLDLRGRQLPCRDPCGVQGGP